METLGRVILVLLGIVCIVTFGGIGWDMFQKGDPWVGVVIMAILTLLSSALAKVERAIDAEDKCATKSKLNQVGKCENKARLSLEQALDLLSQKIQKLVSQKILTNADGSELLTLINTLRQQMLE